MFQVFPGVHQVATTKSYKPIYFPAIKHGLPENPPFLDDVHSYEHPFVVEFSQLPAALAVGRPQCTTLRCGLRLLRTL